MKKSDLTGRNGRQNQPSKRALRQIEESSKRLKTEKTLLKAVPSRKGSGDKITFKEIPNPFFEGESE